MADCKRLARQLRPSAIDVRHLFNGSFVYEIPVGKGRRFLGRGGILDAVIGGWQLGSTFQFHTGLPFTPVMGTANLSGALAGTWRPDRIGSGSIANPSVRGMVQHSGFRSTDAKYVRE